MNCDPDYKDSKKKHVQNGDIPRTQLTSIFEGQEPLQNKAFSNFLGVMTLESKSFHILDSPKIPERLLLWVDRRILLK